MTDGEPKDDERDGGGTDGYESVCTEVAGYGAGGFEFREADEGGVVTFVLLLKRLAEFVEVTGENGNGESDEEGECERGVLLSEGL